MRHTVISKSTAQYSLHAIKHRVVLTTDQNRRKCLHCVRSAALHAPVIWYHVIKYHVF